jgi:hypothetical protein
MLCVYLVNEHPFYLGMVDYSLSMLRTYNPTVPVRVYYIEDGAHEADGKFAVRRSPAEFFDTCQKHNIEVVKKPVFYPPGEERYVCIHRYLFEEIQEETILYIDGDTFIFGDVGLIFDRYAHVDFAAVRGEWVRSFGYDPKLLPVFPFNSGVMYWNHGWHRRWGAELVERCRNLRERRHPVADWLYEVNPQCYNREEFTLPIFVQDHGLAYEYFHEKDVYMLQREEDLLTKVGGQVVLHALTPHWTQVAARLNQFAPSRVRKGRRVFFQKAGSRATTPTA